MITEPGIYQLPGDEYHADPTPTPSLSAGMINDLLVAPAKCFENSKRLNPDYEEKDDGGKFSIGTVSHVIHLEPETFDASVVICEFDDWRKKEAKEKRAAAKADGKTAILAHHLIEVQAARAVFLASDFTRSAFSGGKAEQSLFWRHPVYGFWCRCRPDYMTDAHLCDYKATANAAPSNFGKHAYSMGYYRRCAWYLEGVEAVTGKRPAHYWFCNQETKAPYLTSVVELDYQAIEAGQDENDYAAGIFAGCLETGEWYGYRDRDHLDVDRAFRVGLPNFAYMQIDERLGRQAAAPKAKQHEFEGA